MADKVTIYMLNWADRNRALKLITEEEVERMSKMYDDRRASRFYETREVVTDWSLWDKHPSDDVLRKVVLEEYEPQSGE